MEIGPVDESMPAAVNKRTSPCEAAETDFECPCCADVLLDPIVAPCGHDMCKSCYHKWCQASSGCPRCPSCRAPLPLTLGVCVRLKRIVEDMEPVASKRRRLEQEEEGNKVSWKPATHAACGLSPGAGSLPAWMPSDLQYQQQVGMAAMYAHYQQWGIQWMHAQSQAIAATGTPVADFVHQQHRLNQQAMTGAQRPLPISMWLPGPAGQMPHLAAAEVPTAPAEEPCGSTLSGMPHSTQCRWQSVADVPTRLSCAREILALICARPGAAAGLASADSQRQAAAFTPATLSAVRAVEVALYRSANSREEYLDRSTLPSRVAAFVRRRAAVLVSSPVVTLPSSVAAN